MSAIDDLPPLREVLSRYNLTAKKNLGQNFLLDLNLTSRIARAAGDLSQSHVIEVGPGPGGLTRAILAAGAQHVTLIERDQRCLDALNEIADAYQDRVTIIEGDALKIKYQDLVRPGQATKLIANLPYNIATPLLIGWLKTTPWPPWYGSMTLMFQREVAERIVAQPNDKHFGRLGVIVGWRAQADLVFDVDPRAFTPPPKVTSTVVHLEPRQNPLDCEIAKLERVTAAAFQQRRKMLRASLKSLFDNPVEILEANGINPCARPQTLAVADFIKLSTLL